MLPHSAPTILLLILLCQHKFFAYFILSWKILSFKYMDGICKILRPDFIHLYTSIILIALLSFIIRYCQRDGKFTRKTRIHFQKVWCWLQTIAWVDGKILEMNNYTYCICYLYNVEMLFFFKHEKLACGLWQRDDCGQRPFRQFKITSF